MFQPFFNALSLAAQHPVPDNAAFGTFLCKIRSFSQFGP
jgi:hypothetical protein